MKRRPLRRLALRMARDAGHGRADRVLEALSAEETAELLALETLEPRGPNRDDYRFAQLVCWIVNNIPFRGKDATAVKPEDVFATLRRDPLEGGTGWIEALKMQARSMRLNRG